MENAVKKPTKNAQEQVENSSVRPLDKKNVSAESVDKASETAEQSEAHLLLQQIPDDPGGLLRRKFLYQYRRRGQQPETDRSW